MKWTNADGWGMGNGMSTGRLMARELGTMPGTRAGTAGGAGAAGIERRRETRVDCRKTIELLPCAADDAAGNAREPDWSFLRGDMTDCSVHGIGLVLGRTLRVGERFLLKLRLDRGVSVVLYTVRNCRPAEGRGLYRIGAEFTGYVVAPGDTSRESIVEALMK